MPVDPDDFPARAGDLPAERWPEQIADLADYAADELARAGLDAPQARRLGARVAARLCVELGGARYYWPKGDALVRAMRDLSLWALHDGTTHGPAGVVALARRHGLTEVHLRRILAEQRALHQRGR